MRTIGRVDIGVKLSRKKGEKGWVDDATAQVGHGMLRAR